MLRTWLGAFALVAACFTGCRTETEIPPPPPRTSVVLRFRAAPDMNPNDRGEATPLDVRVYQLKDKQAFTEAAFEELWTTDRVRLGSSLLGEPKVITFEPPAGDTAPMAHELKLDPACQFLGLMGLFSAERKEGLEERKVAITVNDGATKVIALTGHKVRIEDPAK